MYSFAYCAVLATVLFSISTQVTAGYMWNISISVLNHTNYKLTIDHKWKGGDTAWGSANCSQCKPDEHIYPYSSNSYDASAFMFENIHCGIDYKILNDAGERVAICKYDIDSHYDFGWHAHVKHLSCDNSDYHIHHVASGNSVQFHIFHGY